MSQAYDDFIKRMMDILEAHAAPPAPEPSPTDASAHDEPDGRRTTRLALPLTVEMVQAVFRDAPEDPQDWRAQARGAHDLHYASPGALSSGTDQPWTPEQQATIDALRRMVAQVPLDLEAWRAREGLRSRSSTDEPWVEVARQTMPQSATAIAVLPALPTLPDIPTTMPPAPVSLLALPPGPAPAVEQAPKQADPSGQESAAKERAAPAPGQTA